MENRIHLMKLAMVYLLCLTANFAFAQDWPGLKDSLYSNSLKENRQFQVILPDNYNSNSEKLSYEVLYVLDGQYYMKDVPFIYNWTVGSGYMPELILVIIPNVFIDGVNQRSRDFTPSIPAGDEKENTAVGGADSFLTFLHYELDTHIKNKYRTNGKKSLLGSSLSGLFVAYAFVQHPDYFNSYIASDPALWWDDYYIANLAAERLPTFSGVKSTFWMAGLDHSYEDMGIKKFNDILTSSKSNHSKWQCKLYSNETHFSVQLKAFYEGLRFSYFGYNSEERTRYHPKNGILEKGKPISVIFFNSDSLLNTSFTIDDSDPDRSSEKISIGDKISIFQPTILKVKSFGNRQDFNTTEEGRFKISPNLPIRQKEKFQRDPNIIYSQFNGNWENFPDFKTLIPNRIDTINANEEFIKFSKTKADHIHLVQGEFEVNKDGYYIFGVTSEEGAKLLVGELKIIDFGNKGTNEQSFVVPVKKGIYPIQLEVYTRESSGEIDFGCYYAGDFTNEWWESTILVLPEIKW